MSDAQQVRPASFTEFEALWPLKRFVEELPYTVLDVVKATQNLQPFMGRKASLTMEW